MKIPTGRGKNLNPLNRISDLIADSMKVADRIVAELSQIKTLLALINNGVWRQHGIYYQLPNDDEQPKPVQMSYGYDDTGEPFPLKDAVEVAEETIESMRETMTKRNFGFSCHRCGTHLGITPVSPCPGCGCTS